MSTKPIIFVRKPPRPTKWPLGSVYAGPSNGVSIAMGPTWIKPDDKNPGYVKYEKDVARLQAPSVANVLCPARLGYDHSYRAICHTWIEDLKPAGAPAIKQAIKHLSVNRKLAIKQHKALLTDMHVAQGHLVKALKRAKP